MTVNAGTISFSLDTDSRSLIARAVNADGSDAGTFEYRFFTLAEKTPEDFVSHVLEAVKNKPDKLAEYFRYSKRLERGDASRGDSVTEKGKVWHIHLN